MPRKTKDSEEKIDTKKAEKKAKESKIKTTKKADTKKEIVKKETAKKPAKKEVAKKESTKKAAEKKVIKNETSKKPVEEKATKTKKTTKVAVKSEKKIKAVKKSSEEKKETKKSEVKIKTTRTRKTKKEISPVLEYYDLLNRYNQTIVKILAQTPSTLFVYWDISDEDRSNLVKIYGEDFFNNTKPILRVYNETKNYSYEIDINDFANSWYIKLSEPDCKYNIELGRRFIKRDYSNKYNEDNYIYITSSNELITPNDHVLMNFDNYVLFKNIKDNSYFTKELRNIPFIKDYEMYKDIYKKLYPNEILDDLHFNNPSSSFI